MKLVINFFSFLFPPLILLLTQGKGCPDFVGVEGIISMSYSMTHIVHACVCVCMLVCRLSHSHTYKL